MYNNKLIYKVVIWVFFGISLWKENESLALNVDVMIVYTKQLIHKIRTLLS